MLYRCDKQKTEIMQFNFASALKLLVFLLADFRKGEKMNLEVRKLEAKPEPERVSKWGQKASKYDRINIHQWVSGYLVTAFDWYVGNFIYVNILKGMPERPEVYKSVLVVADKNGLEAFKTKLSTLVGAIADMDTVFTRNRTTVIKIDDFFHF